MTLELADHMKDHKPYPACNTVYNDGEMSVHVDPSEDDCEALGVAESVAVLSTVAPGVWVRDIGARYLDGTMTVLLPKEKVHG